MSGQVSRAGFVRRIVVFVVLADCGVVCVVLAFRVSEPAPLRDPSERVV